jgi:hypothetical protein
VAGQRHHVERVLDVAVYAPLGLVLTVRDRVRFARFVGELAVRYSKAEFDRQLAERQAADAAASVDATASAGDDGSVAVPAIERPTDIDAPSAESLPIGDYQSLAAIHVVERLGSLREDEIEQIRRFEAAHRARRTILAKIDQLQDVHGR